MFMVKHLSKVSKQQRALENISKEVSLGRFATEVNCTFLQEGKNLLAGSKKIDDSRLDQIIVGTAILTLAYETNRWYPTIANKYPRTLDQIIASCNCGAWTGLDPEVTRNLILKTGELAINGSLPFDEVLANFETHIPLLGSMIRPIAATYRVTAVAPATVSAPASAVPAIALAPAIEGAPASAPATAPASAPATASEPAIAPASPRGP